MFNDAACYDSATSQALLLGSYVYDNTLHLAKHAWNSDKLMTWIDPTSSTGVSKEVWSRGLGWYAMALVDILKYLPTTHPKYNSIKAMLANLAIGIQNTQDPTTGLWYQVPDKQDSAANYLETSGSAMFVYAMKVASDSGWISSSYLAVAQKGWTGLKSLCIANYTDGKPEIKNFAPAMSVQANYTAYVSSPNTGVTTPTSTAPHGYAAILMAASVMEFPLATALPVHFTSFTAAPAGNTVQLDWNNPDMDNEVSYYSIQLSSDGIVFVNVGRQKADGSSIYHWTDNAVTGKILYYRIAAVDADGAVYYSDIRVVKLKTGQPAMTVSPNPLNGRTLNFRVNDITPGAYSLSFINSAGKTMAVVTVNIAAEGANQAITLPATLQKGFYYIKLDTGSGSITGNILVN